MKKPLIATTAAVFMVATTLPSFAVAVAPRVPTPPPPTTGNSGHGWVPGYVFGATTCSALFLWLQALQTSQTQKRELTQREAWTIVGNCWLPLIGGELAKNLHDKWKPKN